MGEAEEDHESNRWRESCGSAHRDDGGGRIRPGGARRARPVGRRLRSIRGGVLADGCFG